MSKHESEISVAVIEQSERSDNLINPLLATKMDVAVDPPDPYSRDIVVLDTPDRELAYEVLKKPLHDAQIVFRMRGDPFFGIDEWIDSRLKCWLANNVVIPGVDACVTITPHHADLFQKKTGIYSGVAELPAYPDEWPDTTHEGSELRIATLTNAVYRPKIEPLIRYMPAVEAVLKDVGGYWRICGDGNYADRLDAAVQGYDHIHYPGYVDAYEELDRANLMLHLSNLDGWPNAALEGMSSHLPVITNDHHAFTDKARPNEVIDSQTTLRSKLYKYMDPEVRQERGSLGEAYVRAQHNDERVGRAYVQYFRQLLSRDSFEQLHGMPHPEPTIDYDG